MPRHPSHDPDPMSGQCRACGMTAEEMLDFDIIECGDANEARMPRPQPAFIDGDLTDEQHQQRGLMIEGLWSRADRRRKMTDRLVWWPRELEPPAFDGTVGKRTVAPSSVKLTPPPVEE